MVPTQLYGAGAREIPTSVGETTEDQRTTHAMQRQNWNPGPPSPVLASGSLGWPLAGVQPLPTHLGSHGLGRAEPWVSLAPQSAN